MTQRIMPPHDVGTHCNKAKSMLAGVNGFSNYAYMHPKSLVERVKLEAEHYTPSARIDSRTGLFDDQTTIALLAHMIHSQYMHLGGSMDRQNNSKFTLVAADIDNFKDINGDISHEGGNEVLEAVGNALKRGSDLPIGRVGGEEFYFLLPYTDARGAEIVIEKVRDKLASIAVRGVKPAMTYGICEVDLSGIGCLEDLEDSDLNSKLKELSTELIEKSDLAKESGKLNGKDCVRIFNDDMPAEISKYKSMVEYIRELVNDIDSVTVYRHGRQRFEVFNVGKERYEGLVLPEKYKGLEDYFVDAVSSILGHNGARKYVNVSADGIKYLERLKPFRLGSSMMFGKKKETARASALEARTIYHMIKNNSQ